MNITTNPEPWMKRLSLKYRETGDKQDKAKLPAITPGGVFSPNSRVADNVVHKTGLVCFDIDAKDNTHIQNWEKVKEELAHNKYIIFTALSTSGNGCFGFVKIKDPDKQEEHFTQLSADLKKTYDLTVDSSKGELCNDLRYYSYDPQPFYNPDWEVYNGLPKITFSKPVYRPKAKIDSPDKTIQKVKAVVQEVQDRNIDLNPTCDYETYRALAWAFCDNSISPYNRELFHQAMSTHSKYRYGISDKEFTKLQKSYRQGRTTIATFFSLCKDQGINLGEVYKNSSI